MIKFHKRTRMFYWCHSKVFSWMLPDDSNTKKVFTADEMDEMFEYLDKKPCLAESVIDKLQDILMFPLDVAHSVRIHFKNKKGKTHVLSAGLYEGSWYDLTYRIPVCLFTELEKFIEQEKGMETHEWEKTLIHDDEGDKDESFYGQLTQQALSAIEQDVIYKWWQANKNREYTNWEDEQRYEAEEQEMLIRLVKIYRSLWS